MRLIVVSLLVVLAILFAAEIRLSPGGNNFAGRKSMPMTPENDWARVRHMYEVCLVAQ